MQLVKDHNFLGEIPNITHAAVELIKSGAAGAATTSVNVLLVTASTVFLRLGAFFSIFNKTLNLA